MKPLLLFLAPQLLSAACLSAACTVLNGDRITAADLARTQAEFSALAPDTPLGFAPRFGARRDLSSAELTRLARASRISLTDPRPVCFERSGRILNAADILAALPVPADWSVELLGDQYAGRPAPAGRLVFERNALPRQAPFDVAIWKGRIADDQNLSHPFWIRVRLRKTVQVLRARAALRPGDQPTADQLEAVTVERYPLLDEPLSPGAGIPGRLRRAVAAGQPLRAADFVTPRAIERGDIVEVRLDEALLRVEAESPGRTGELVLLKNPLTGKRFQARVTGPRAAELAAARSTSPKP